MAIYSTHYIFESPEDENATIWRYLSFSKFISLLQTSALHFTVADKFEDKWEGLLPAKFRQGMDDKLISFFESARLKNAINCWHMKQYESATMWKNYVPNGEGVAIKSTFKRLIECFNVNDLTPTATCDIRIGKVKYDYEDYNSFDLSNGFIPLLRKRKYFIDESEVRAVIGGGDLSQSFKEGAYGTSVPIDLKKLIEEVYVDPVAPDWFYEMIKSILEKKYIVKQSVIAERPLKVGKGIPPVDFLTTADLGIK